jgi:hypothetical protein
MKNHITQHDERVPVWGGAPRSHAEDYVDAHWHDAFFLRLPLARTRCPITNLSRSTLEELINDGLIPAKKLRRPGQTRAITLIPKAGLVDFVMSLPDAARDQSTASLLREASTVKHKLERNNENDR